MNILGLGISNTTQKEKKKEHSHVLVLHTL